MNRFFDEASKDEEIRVDLTNHADTPDSFHRKVVEYGRSLGYDFSEEDLREALSSGEDRELSEQEMNISGGGLLDSIIEKGLGANCF